MPSSRRKGNNVVYFVALTRYLKKALAFCGHGRFGLWVVFDV